VDDSVLVERQYSPINMPHRVLARRSSYGNSNQVQRSWQKSHTSPPLSQGGLVYAPGSVIVESMSKSLSSGLASTTDKREKFEERQHGVGDQ